MSSLSRFLDVSSECSKANLRMDYDREMELSLEMESLWICLTEQERAQAKSILSGPED